MSSSSSATLLSSLCSMDTEEDASHTFESELELELESGYEEYKYEPEYTEEELRKTGINFSDGESSSVSSSSCSDDQDSRLENLHWCSCSCCVITLTMNREEAVCCREYNNLLHDKLDGIKCITFHEEFKTLCLNRIVLETSAIRERRYKNVFKNGNVFLNR